MAAPREGVAALTGPPLSTPSTSRHTPEQTGLRQRYPRVPGEHGTWDTGQEATQRPWERDMGRLGGEAGSAQRPRHLIQCLGACQAEAGSARHWWARLPWLLGVSWAPLKGCRARPGMSGLFGKPGPGVSEGGPAWPAAKLGTAVC